MDVVRIFAYEVYLLLDEREDWHMPQGTSIKQCEEGLKGKLVTGGLERAGLGTAEKESSPWIPTSSVYFPFGLFIPEKTALAQGEPDEPNKRKTDGS